MNRPMVAPAPGMAPTRFRSVRRPHLGVLLRTDDPETTDVWRCENCNGYGETYIRAKWGDTLDVPCLAEDGGCDGHGWIHGKDRNGHGLPAEPIDDESAEAESKEDRAVA